MFEPLEPPAIPRREVLDELIAAVRGGQAPLHSGEWGRATLAVCLALLESARTGREIAIERS
jgi:phthalate 4,5-cis-dihydrodiol dehydrogenase